MILTSDVNKENKEVNITDPNPNNTTIQKKIHRFLHQGKPRKPGEKPGEKPSDQGDNQQQTLPTKWDPVRMEPGLQV